MPNMNQYSIIALHNIDTEDFTFEYDRSSGNYPYTIPAGEIRRFPAFLASHALKHLIDKILTKRNIKTDNETARAELREQIVISEEAFQQEKQKTEAEVLKEQVETLNRPSELDMILEKRRKQPQVPTVAGEPAPPKEGEHFEGLEPKELEPDKDDVGPEIDTTEKAPEPVEEVKLMPTRNEIIEYAKNTLKMTIDDELQKKLDKMKIEDLLKELGDPRDKLT